jgi:hypothetical protein
MEVIGQLHAPAPLPPGKEPPVHIGEESGWAPEPFWTRWWREKFPAPPPKESSPRPSIVQPVAQRYTDWAITALITAVFPQYLGNLGTRWRWIVIFTLRLLHLQYPLGRGLGGPHSRSRSGDEKVTVLAGNRLSPGLLAICLMTILIIIQY